MCSETEAVVYRHHQRSLDYAGSEQMEPLLQALLAEGDSGRVLRKHIEKSSNSVCASASLVERQLARLERSVET